MDRGPRIAGWLLGGLLAATGLSAPAAADARKCRFDGFRAIHVDGRTQVLEGRTPAAVIACDAVTGSVFALDPDIRRERAVLDPRRTGRERYGGFSSAGVRLAYTVTGGDGRLVRSRSVRGGPVAEAAVPGPWLLARDGTVAWRAADGVRALEPGRPERLIVPGAITALAAGASEASIAYADGAVAGYTRLRGRAAPPPSHPTSELRTSPKACETQSAPLIHAVGRVHVRQREGGIPVICDARTGAAHELSFPGGRPLPRITFWSVSGPWLVYQYRGYDGSLELLNVRTGVGRYLAELGIRTTVVGAAVAADGSAAWMTSQSGGPGTFQNLTALPAGAARAVEIASGQTAVGQPDEPLDAASLALSTSDVPVVYWRGPGGEPAFRPLQAPAEIVRGGGSGFVYLAGPGESNAVVTEMGAGDEKILSVFEDAGRALPVSEGCTAERPDRVVCSQRVPTNIGKPVAFDFRPYVSLRDGDDTVQPRAGGVVADGGPGADRLTGGDDPDRLSGGPGTDVLLGGGDDDLLLGSEGDDRYEGGEGEDTISFERSTRAATIVLAQLPGIEHATGGPGDDTLSGSAAANELDGGGGDDTITAGAGADRVTVATGADAVDCGDDADTVTTLIRRGAFGPLTGCERLVARIDTGNPGGIKNAFAVAIDDPRLPVTCDECEVTARRSGADIVLAGTVTYATFGGPEEATFRLRITSP